MFDHQLLALLRIGGVVGVMRLLVGTRLVVRQERTIHGVHGQLDAVVGAVTVMNDSVEHIDERLQRVEANTDPSN